MPFGVVTEEKTNVVKPKKKQQTRKKPQTNLEERLKKLEEKLQDSSVVVVDKIIKSQLKKVLKAYYKQYRTKSEGNTEMVLILSEYFNINLLPGVKK